MNLRAGREFGRVHHRGIFVRPDRELKEHRSVVKDKRVYLGETFENIDVELCPMRFAKQCSCESVEIDCL